VIEPPKERDVAKPDESQAKSVSTDFNGRLLSIMSAFRIGVSDGLSKALKID
jgi:hypothetical protein